VDQGSGFVVEAFAPLDVEIAITKQRLVQREHEHAPLQGPANGCEARCCDLLKDRHKETERASLAAMPLGEIESVFEIFAQLLVKAPFPVLHHERFGVDPAPREQRLPVRPARVRLGAAEHHGVQAMSMLDHLLRTAKQRRIEQLHDHPELEVIALMRRRGKQDEVPRLAL
jgi:hypothetical protein